MKFEDFIKDIIKERLGVTKVCKKILVEFQDNKAVPTNAVLVLQEIIKNLGVEV